MQTISQFKVAVPFLKFGIYINYAYTTVYMSFSIHHIRMLLYLCIYTCTSNPKNRYSYKNSVKKTMSFNFNIFNVD